MIKKISLAPTSGDAGFSIPTGRFDNPSYIQKRVQAAPDNKRELLRVLRYLYISDGPVNLQKKVLQAAEKHLEPQERIVARWLQTRTNGNQRKDYGRKALAEARAARYRCRRCGYKDVRALHLDHVYGKQKKVFACQCANCHNIKSRKFDWTGENRRQAAKSRIES